MREERRVVSEREGSCEGREMSCGRREVSCEGNEIVVREKR